MDADPQAVASSIRELAGRVRRKFPGHIAADHVGDAAGALDLGLHDGAVRHLNAAIGSLSRESMLRRGIANDGGGNHSNVPDVRRNHAVALGFADDCRRHALLVRDLQGDAARDGSGRFAGGDDGTAQFASPAGTTGTVELANRALAQMQL
jgi:hypothetical protein